MFVCYLSFQRAQVNTHRDLSGDRCGLALILCVLYWLVCCCGAALPLVGGAASVPLDRRRPRRRRHHQNRMSIIASCMLLACRGSAFIGTGSAGLFSMLATLNNMYLANCALTAAHLILVVALWLIQSVRPDYANVGPLGVIRLRDRRVGNRDTPKYDDSSRHAGPGAESNN